MENQKIVLNIRNFSICTGKKKEFTDHANPEGNGPQRWKERGRRGSTGPPQPLAEPLAEGQALLLGPDRCPRCVPRQHLSRAASHKDRASWGYIRRQQSQIGSSPKLTRFSIYRLSFILWLKFYLTEPSCLQQGMHFGLWLKS